MVSPNYPAVQVPQSHIDLLERPLFAHFATIRADGSPQVNPMWFWYDALQGLIKLTHTKTRHNFRYVQLEPRVALSITDPDNQYRYLQVRGAVESILDDPEGKFYQFLQRRYRGVISTVTDRGIRVVLNIRPAAFRTWDGPARVGKSNT